MFWVCCWGDVFICELFFCFWFRNGCFFLMGLVWSGVCGWCVVLYFVLEKFRLVGRKERGRGVVGGVGVGGRGWLEFLGELLEWGWVFDGDGLVVIGCLMWFWFFIDFFFGFVFLGLGLGSVFFLVLSCCVWFIDFKGR